MKTRNLINTLILCIIFAVPIVFGFKLSPVVGKDLNAVDALTQIHQAIAMYEEYCMGDLAIVETDKDQYGVNEQVVILLRFNNPEEDLAGGGWQPGTEFGPYYRVTDITEGQWPPEYQDELDLLEEYGLAHGSQIIARGVIPANTFEPGVKKIKAWVYIPGCSGQSPTKIIEIKRLATGISR